MQIFTEYVAWQNYAATELATAEVVEERAEVRLKFLEAEGLVKSWAPKDTVTQIKARLAGEPAIDAAAQERLNAYAARKMTQVIRDNCERCAALVSRILEVRNWTLETGTSCPAASTAARS